MTPREEVIQECIQRIKDRPGRNAITTLEGMLKTLPEVAKQTKPAPTHHWRRANELKRKDKL